MQRQRVIDKCEALKRARFWGSPNKVKVRGWLSNFENDHEDVALFVLDNFVFYSKRMCDKMLEEAWNRLRVHVEKEISNYGGNIDSWRDFHKRAVFTRVEGENPNPTDSGNLFCRKGRQIFGISESQIMRPSKAIEESGENKPLVFLDDFVGSGSQLKTTWKRLYGPKYKSTFSDAYKKKDFKSHFVCLIATKYSLDRLSNTPINIHSSHVIGSNYNIRSKLSDDKLERLDKFLERYKNRLDYPFYLKENTKKYGFHELGLTIAFYHSVPDSTLPIIWAEGNNNWTTLVKRK